MNLTNSCKQIHKILQASPKHHEPLSDLPQNGIYFFYEKGEICSHAERPRIVRVGIHGERATLRKRLRQHYRLNREGSVFRKHLGTALLKRKGFPDDEIIEWKKCRKSPRWSDFKGVEDEVSRVLRSKFFFKVVAVDDVEERKTLEEKLIASLAACPHCRPSEGWLGRFAWSEKIRKSGLWNSNYVDSENKMDASDLKRLNQLVRADMRVLFFTHCCAKKDDSLKSTGRKVLPMELYKATPTQRFMRKCVKTGVGWAIFSDKYAFVFPDDRIAWYEKHPSTLTDIEKRKLFDHAFEVLKNYDFVCFYYNPGRLHQFYRELVDEMRRRGRKIREITHLDNIS